MIVSEPGKRGKRAFRLHITITLVFVILTLPVTIIFGIMTYRANAQLIANHTDRFVQKTLSDEANNIGKLLSPMTKEAYADYANGRFDNAAVAYEKILKKFPNDPVAQRMLEKSRMPAVKLIVA